MGAAETIMANGILKMKPMSQLLTAALLLPLLAAMFAPKVHAADAPRKWNVLFLVPMTGGRRWAAMERRG